MSTAESKTRDAICALGAKLAARGLCPGTSGNISARIADGWLMTPTNSSLGELEPGQLSKLDLSSTPPPSRSWRRSADQCVWWCSARHAVPPIEKST